MYGQGIPFRPPGGARGAAQPHPPPPHFFPQNANPYLFNSTPYVQNPNSLASHNPYLQNPNFPIQQFQSTYGISPNPNQTLERIDRAVAKARRDLRATGEHISAWRVSEYALLSLRADSWSSLGFQMQKVPSMHRLMVSEGKVNSFIHCFVGVRRITSLFDLDVAICKNEGVEKFEELELGPLLRHPLVLHYFSVPPDVKEVFKITSEELISCLAEYMDSYNGKDILAEGFLDFVAMKRSVTVREKLCVRIQSLRMHTTYIQEAMKAEESTLKNYLQALSHKQTKKMNGKLNHHPSISSQKEVLDRRFRSISRSIKSFSSIHEDFGGKHIRFVSSSSEGESDTEDDCKGGNVLSSQGKLSSEKRKSCDQRMSTCPYPSADEEMVRLGLKMEMGGQPSPVSGSLSLKKRKKLPGKKRKCGNQSADAPYSHKVPKRDGADSNVLDLYLLHGNDNCQYENAKSQSAHGDVDNIGDLMLTSDTVEEFITTWKETCRMHSVAEVFDKMLHFYHTEGRQRDQFPRLKKMKSSIREKNREKMKSLFSSFPCIGLLNVAVTSIKRGMWDSLYDTFQTIVQHGCATPATAPSDFERIDIEPSNKDDALSLNEPSSQLENSVSCSLHNSGVTVADIIKKISSYFELDHTIPGEGKSYVEKQFMCLRKLRNCEIWLTKQFSVKEFDSLGCGEFFKFLEEHSSLLPNAYLEVLTGDVSQKSLLEVSMLQHQLVILLSQAASNLWENDIITKQHISMLLRKQFPLIGFQVNGKDPLEDLSEILKVHKNTGTSSCVLFSVTLFEACYIRDSLVGNQNHLSETIGVKADLGLKSGPLGSVSSKDAIECLLKAPMLSDLQSWSHWDLIFAPSLGPLVEWLLNEVHTKELLCLMTKDGKLIRIDQSATVDEFLEASVKGSSFQAAVKLLSLFSLYGGERHSPLTLLKCLARRAIEVILKNSMDYMEVKSTCDIDMPVKASRGQLLDEKNSASPLILDPSGTVVDMANRDQFKNQFWINKAVPLASRFILDCLSYLPPEFHSYGADILLSGLQSFTKDASSAILRECRQIDHRLMLHEIGLSLGILEWIADYHTFNSAPANELFMSFGASSVNASSPAFILDLKYTPDASESLNLFDDRVVHPVEIYGQNEIRSKIHDDKFLNDVSNENCGGGCKRISPKHDEDQDAAFIIESIRREEFGLVPGLTHEESSVLKKQHARLGRALHCLSQELYSQDSHFLLELVQNADDNTYPEKVEPTLVFILQATGIIILNNEQGFSGKNIRALCDVGNSTKRGSSAGYIGQKGIGFKSVFRVTDAPEIHSNGFHVKFDISEGQIGFVLPAVVSPCDVGSFRRLVPTEVDQVESTCWNTCIMLPFKSNLREGTGISTITNMFSDLHPSLLLFLHRLRCLKFKNMLNDSFIVMRKETVGNGIVKVSNGKEKMTWFVATQKLDASVIRPDVQSTEIAVALTLQESSNGEYSPHLDQQPVFAFLPLRAYGLKFILQGDFVLTSSREEIDGDSAWNQWLLSEFPSLFVSAQRSFCELPCFQESPGKAVAAYMSFVPLVGEVHGFFSHLPRMIISKLRISSCLLLEGHNKEWVPPCKVLRGWNEHSRILLPENLLHEHLGLGYLDKKIILSDPLAKALGVQDYGPKILIDIISSICHTNNAIELLGLDWLSSWINALYTMLVHTSGQNNVGVEADVDKILRKVPFIPLSDGTHGSVDEGTIWLPCDALGDGFKGEHGPEAFPSLYAKLRTVSPSLLHAAAINSYSMEEKSVDNLVRMLHRIGVQRFTAHEIIIVHILPAISDDRITNRDKNLMTEYLTFIMLHLQSSCASCRIERQAIVSELQNKAFILTNHGYKRPFEVSIHFSREFGNPVDVHKLIDAIDSKWHEVDLIYLTHPSTKTSPFGLVKWREFLQELGITDFVQVVQTEKNMIEASNTVLKNILCDGELIPPNSVIKDWESPELVHMLSVLSSQNNLEKCKYLLEVLDNMWDDCFSAKATGCCISKSIQDGKPFKSSFITSIHDVRWIASSMDQMLHYPKDLFYDCEAVRSILGTFAPYAVPQVRSKHFLHDIGFKIHVTLDDALGILQVWSSSKTPFKTSIAQMSKFYAFIWNGISNSKEKFAVEFCSRPSIFVPFTNVSRHEDVVSGIFVSPEEVYWHDPTGSVDRTKELILQCGSFNETNYPISMTLAHVYQGFHEFFVKECGVSEIPPFRRYLQILLKLSNIALPSQTANAIFEVLLKWVDDLKYGLVGSEDITYLKEYLLKLEGTVLPTVHDKWVSLHPSFGLVCWCDDDELKKQFKHSDNINFIYFGELSNDKKEMIPAKIAQLMQTIGIPSLSEVVTREAIFYGMEDQRDKALLVNWVLPYAQRYIYKLHLDKYLQFKRSGFENLSHLRIFVVEKLFYRHIIKGCSSKSKKRFQCSCLLQDNNLYMTGDSDSHSIFSELSRIFFNGAVDIHLANFLHMIATMAESGSTKEQMEFFIVNSQKVPKLPDEEPVWFLSSLSSLQEEDDILHSLNSISPTVDEKNLSKSKRKPGINPNWPPVDWKTAPDFSFSKANRFRTFPVASPPSEDSQKEDKPEGIITCTDSRVPVGVGVDWIIQDDSAATTMAIVLQDTRTTEDQHPSVGSSGPVCRSMNNCLEVLNESVDVVNVPENPDTSQFDERVQLSFGTCNEYRAAITGRLGELIAFKYFAERVGEAGVKWVNEETETGLPYDIIIGEKEEHKEYVEVKATKYLNKDWFNISTREWQFAVDRGESFSIAHVVLMGPNKAKVTVFKNPVRLCQQGILQLAVLMSKHQRELSIVS